MKTIGLIGGMSWESSKVYYELINELTREKLGGFHSARCIMDSVDFADVEALQVTENWKALNELMVSSAIRLEKAGAECIVLCTNTMHICSGAIQKNIDIPFMHIAQATGEAIIQQKLKKVALLGTRFTMEKDFYKSFMYREFGIETIIPSKEDRIVVHDTIYDELVIGKIKKKSREKMVQIINSLEKVGAEGVILGCTELPLLISEKDVSLPIFDTTFIHARKAVSWSIEDSLGV